MSKEIPLSADATQTPEQKKEQDPLKKYLDNLEAQKQTAEILYGRLRELGLTHAVQDIKGDKFKIVMELTSSAQMLQKPDEQVIAFQLINHPDAIHLERRNGKIIIIYDKNDGIEHANIQQSTGGTGKLSHFFHREQAKNGQSVLSRTIEVDSPEVERALYVSQGIRAQDDHITPQQLTDAGITTGALEEVTIPEQLQSVIRRFATDKTSAAFEVRLP